MSPDEEAVFSFWSSATDVCRVATVMVRVSIRRVRSAVVGSDMADWGDAAANRGVWGGLFGGAAVEDCCGGANEDEECWESDTRLSRASGPRMRPVPMTPSITPRLAMYPPMAPLGQQLFYGQAPPSIMPPQPGFGFQQQLVPGMRPGGAHMPNYFVPVVQQGQQGPRPGIRRSGAGSAQGQQPAPQSFQQQMLPRGRMYRYPPARNMPDVPQMPGVVGGMIQSYDMGGFPVRDAGLSTAPIGTLTSALANATPEQQRMV
ncbi:hypothetical protein GUJ93_ZPchr0004g40457 [Zizania palustris]|uniref:Uncharacterized protein n=1 Tax=Zizania palustris TaxID=103762 RepID=A0A8J5VYX1_ZIZPA|nr:hypothetical protein GUJ93_ZPchr0004g40457 [Zizania palustris]